MTEYELMKNILPKNTLKPVTQQMKENTSLILEDRIKINTNNKNSLTFYMSNSIKLEKVFNSSKLNELNKKEYNIKDNSDIVIKGLGFINVKKACTVTIYNNNEDLIEIRESMFK